MFYSPLGVFEDVYEYCKVIMKLRITAVRNFIFSEIVISQPTWYWDKVKARMIMRTDHSPVTLDWRGIQVR